MKKTCCCTLAVLSLFLLASQVQAEGLTRITDRIYSYSDTKNPSPANSFGANAGIIIGDKGILVIDSLGSTQEARRLISDIRKVSDKPIRYVVDTHSHFDHTFGNAEFAALGAVIVAQDNCTENLKASSQQVIQNAKSYGMSDEEAKAVQVAYPNVSFSNKTRIGLGGVNVDLLFIAPSHTGDSLIVSVPEEKIVFAGDILFTDYYPYMGDGDIQGWVKTLDHLMTMDADKIVPGHGPVSTKKEVKEMKDFILAFDRKASELCAKSVDLPNIAAEMKKSLPLRSQADFLIMGSIQTKYLKAKN